MIYKLGEKIPKIDNDTFIAKSADVMGDVEISKGVSVWFSAVIRGDVEKIIIGENSNIQDNATIHTDFNIPCIVGKNVTVGHNAILHSCIIGDNTIVGMGATVMNGAVVAKNCMIGANSLVTKSIPLEEGVLILGNPARIVRKLSDDEIKSLSKNGEHYVQNGKRFKAELEEIKL